MSAKNSVEVSHGRGGAGNIGPDSTVYGDGEIVREGAVGDHGDGAYSSGRGGQGNIGSPGIPATKRNDEIIIPDVATRPSMEHESFHVGRGGTGNVHLAQAEQKKHPEGLADKLKNKLFKKKEKTNTTTTTT